YPSDGRPELNDRIFFEGETLRMVTSGSPDPRYPTRERIEQTFGPPEAQTLFQTQQYLDYTSKGLRFICGGDGKTTGVIYFAPRHRRVPEGYPNERIDLRRTLPEPTA